MKNACRHLWKTLNFVGFVFSGAKRMDKSIQSSSSKTGERPTATQSLEHPTSIRTRWRGTAGPVTATTSTGVSRRTPSPTATKTNTSTTLPLQLWPGFHTLIFSNKIGGSKIHLMMPQFYVIIQLFWQKYEWPVKVILLCYFKYIGIYYPYLSREPWFLYTLHVCNIRQCVPLRDTSVPLKQRNYVEFRLRKSP